MTDVAWWDAIASHPEVAPHVFMGSEPLSIAAALEPSTIALRSENGGCLFLARDPFGLTRELHTLYRPEGWGREVALAARGFLHEVFRTASVIVTHEQEGHWRSRPPRSQGWIASDDFRDVGLPRRLRTWVLTRDAWLNSPVGRKTCR